MLVKKGTATVGIFCVTSEKADLGVSRDSVTVEDPTVTDGPTVAGLPSKWISSAGSLNGQPAGIDMVAFGDDNGVYVVTTVYVDLKSLDSWRANGLSTLLKTVEIAKP